ncbi:MAG: site-specific DNA-methyltransferase [Robiginitomaculum sp.]
MIYIDPPYNTGKDFIYKDNFTAGKTEYMEDSGQINADGGKLVANPESNGRYHSDWLSMMYPRLKLARNLLRDDGVIFISIGEDEVDSLKKTCCEVFGEDNFVSLVARVAKRTSNKGTYFRPTKDYIIVCAKQKSNLSEFGVTKNVKEKDYKLVDDDGRKYKQSGASLYQPSLDSRPNQRYYIEAPDGSLIIPPGNVFPKEKNDGSKIKPVSNSDKVWRWSVDTYLKQKHLLMFTKGSSKNPLLDENRVQSKWNIYPKVFHDVDSVAKLVPEDIIYDFPNSQGTKELKALSIPFSFAKPTGLLEYLLELIESEGSIILDFFAGASTTAHATMKTNTAHKRGWKFISVQLPEICDESSEASQAGYLTIAEISKERIRRAGAKILADNPDQVGKLDIGFRVLKIDSSNMNDVYYAPGDVDQTSLLDSVEHIKGDRSAEDLLFQVMLDLGVDLSLRVVRETVDSKTVYTVGDNDLAACFDMKITEDLVKTMTARKPLRAVFRDDGFSSDDMKINAGQLFDQMTSGHTDMKVI